MVEVVAQVFAVPRILRQASRADLPPLILALGRVLVVGAELFLGQWLFRLPFLLHESAILVEVICGSV